MTLIVAMAILIQTLMGAQMEVTSSDAADAAEAATGQRAHMTHEIRRLTGRRMSGPAATILLTRDDGASAVEAGMAAIKFLETIPAGSVVVASLDGDKAFAVFGASFGVLAQARQLAGFVIDGAARDAAVLDQTDFPVFARGFAAGSAGGHYRVAAINVPVQSGGVTVSPGDFIVADEDGVAVVPGARRDDILKDAMRRQKDERILLARIAETKSYLQVLTEQRNDVDELTRLNALYVDSVAQASAAQFEAILATDFLCSNPDGSLVDRAQFLAQIARAPKVKIELSDVRIRVAGDTAIIHAMTTFTLAGGQTGRGRYTDVWSKRDGRWLAVSAHVTRVM
jgi:regulator of RNase E activity RraA/ketosteroid isomerase-like protein